jgi:hypothetical protein
LHAIARPAREKRRLPPAEMRALVAELYRGHYRTAREIAHRVGREKDKLQDRFLAPMVRDGLLRLRFPGEPNHPDQAYTPADH